MKERVPPAVTPVIFPPVLKSGRSPEVEMQAGLIVQ